MHVLPIKHGDIKVGPGVQSQKCESCHFGSWCNTYQALLGRNSSYQSKSRPPSGPWELRLVVVLDMWCWEPFQQASDVEAREACEPGQSVPQHAEVPAPWLTKVGGELGMKLCVHRAARKGWKQRHKTLLSYTPRPYGAPTSVHLWSHQHRLGTVAGQPYVNNTQHTQHVHTAADGLSTEHWWRSEVVPRGNDVKLPRCLELRNSFC